MLLLVITLYHSNRNQTRTTGLACFVSTDQFIFVSLLDLTSDPCLMLHIDGWVRAMQPNRGVHLILHKELNNRCSPINKGGRPWGKKNRNHQYKDASLVKSRDLGQQYSKAEAITWCPSGMLHSWEDDRKGSVKFQCRCWPDETNIRWDPERSHSCCRLDSLKGVELCIVAWLWRRILLGLLEPAGS